MSCLHELGLYSLSYLQELRRLRFLGRLGLAVKTKGPFLLLQCCSFAGLVVPMLIVTAVNAASLGHTGMLKTDGFNETELVLHLCSSSSAGKHFSCYDYQAVQLFLPLHSKCLNILAPNSAALPHFTDISIFGRCGVTQIILGLKLLCLDLLTVVTTVACCTSSHGLCC